MLKRKTPLKRGKPLKSSNKPLKANKPKKEMDYTLEQLKAFFEQIWDERCDNNGCCIDYENGITLSPSYKYNISCYHHLLFKKNYPQYVFLKENIVILHPDTHNLVHHDVSQCPKVKDLTEMVLKKHKSNEYKNEYTGGSISPL